MPASAQAATLKGKVSLEGTVPQSPAISMDADPICKAMHKDTAPDQKVVLNPDKTLQNVFVYIKEGVAPGGEAPKSPAVLDQHGCMYQPHVLGLQTGQPLTISNSDATLHNVHALGKNNPEFNLGMPLQNMKLDKTFFNPEVMLKFKCDVHPWMSAYVGVVPHLFFDTTAETGEYEITGLAPGDYTVEAWHETYGLQTQKIQIAGDEVKTADFTYSTGQIADEATGVAIKTEAPKPIELYDDSAAINRPREKTGWWLPESISTYGPKIDFLFYVILWITGIVFFGVQGTLIVFLFRYRYRKDKKAHYTHGSTTIEIVWTVIPAVIVVVLALMGQGVWADVKSHMPQENKSVRIRVKAEQFAWNIQYPGADGKFDTPDDIKNINQLHIPVGKPVRVTLTSIETAEKPAVLHSFFLPEFRLKQDAVPGMAIDLWFEAKKTGKYEIACAEFCGIGHYRMRGFLTIHSPEGFDAWLKEAAVS